MKNISNSQLTLARKLNRKKYREQEQLFLIEGSRAVQQIITNGILEIRELFFDESQSYWDQEPWAQIIPDYSCSLVSKEHFEEISDTENPQGVLALCKMPGEAEIEELAEADGILLATDRIQDPGNLGTIIRTASWFGAKALLSGKGTVDIFHPKVVRSTAGATGTLKYRNGELGSLLPTFESRGWRVVILEGSEGAQNIRDLKPADKTILLVGNEANGVAENLFTDQRTEIRIPSMSEQEQVESLNAAIAAAIALFVING